MEGSGDNIGAPASPAGESSQRVSPSVECGLGGGGDSAMSVTKSLSDEQAKNPDVSIEQLGETSTSKERSEEMVKSNDQSGGSVESEKRVRESPNSNEQSDGVVNSIEHSNDAVKSIEQLSKIDDKVAEETDDDQTDHAVDNVQRESPVVVPADVAKEHEATSDHVYTDETKVTEESSTNVLEKEPFDQVTEKVSDTTKMNENDEKVSEEISEKVSEENSEKVSEEISEKVSEEIPKKVSEEISEKVSEEISEKVSEEISEKISEEISEESSSSIEKPQSDVVTDLEETSKGDTVAEPEASNIAREEPMHTSPSNVTGPGSMDIEEISQSAPEISRKENEVEMNLEDDRLEADVNMDKGTEEETKAMDEEPEESTSQDDELSMNLDEHSGEKVGNPTEEETSMNLSEGGDDEHLMDQDTQFIHVDSNKDRDGVDSMSVADVSQSGEESMEVSVIQDEDPFSGTTDKQGDDEEAMDVEDAIDIEKINASSQETTEQKTENSEKSEDKIEAETGDETAPEMAAEAPPTTDNDSEPVPAVDKEQEKVVVAATPFTAATPSADDDDDSNKVDDPPETITGDKSVQATNAVAVSSVDDSIIRKDTEEEICIIPDTVPRVILSQDASAASINKNQTSDIIEESNKRMEDKELENKGSPKSIYTSGKEWRGKHKDGHEGFTRRKSSGKSIDDITERIWEKSAGLDSIKDGTKRTPTRPQRQAAKKAVSQIKEIAEEDANSNESGEIPLKHNEVVEVEGTVQMCIQCYRVRTCKYQLFLSGKARYLCQDECFNSYRKEVASKSGKIVGLVNDKAPSSGSGDPDKSFIRKCAQCHSSINGDESNLSWETMDYCNESCLGKYQNQLGSHCANCKGPVQQLSLGKYCVRFGYDVKQFCCSTCLEEFKKGLKVCSYCQKDISGGTEGFLAPVGDKGQFKDFCTQACMEKYDQMSNNQPAPVVVHQCAVCNNEKVVKVEVIHNNVLNKLCSEPCFAAFKFVNTIVADQCDMCKKYFDKSKMENFTVFYDDVVHNFCCKTCMNVYILANRKIVPCNWCKVKKYNFDMIKQVTNGGQVFMMCSLNCLTLYKVSVNAVSPKRVKCDMCQYVNPAQYHLTMSDATIRNFCTYQCVMQFQGQFNKTTPLTMTGADSAPIPTGAPKRSYHRRASSVTQNENQIAPKIGGSSNMPVISSVTSLAPNGQAVSPNNAAGITTRSAALKQMNNNGVNVQQNQQGKPTQIVYKQQVLVRPAQPKTMKNKSVLCRPYMHTKGVSCRPHPCTKETQTDDSLGKPVLIPVPVPIYVPAPMHMYSTPFPVPVPFPLPVPVPVFIPTTRNSANGIMKEIKRIQEKIPADPFEAELLMMAEMVAEEKKGENSDSESDDDGGNDAGDASEVPGASSVAEDGFSPEVVDTSNTFGEDMLQMALKMASELDEPAVDLEAALTPSTITAQSQTSMEQNDATESEDDPEPVAALPENRVTVRRKRSARMTRSTVPSKRGRRGSSSVDLPLMPPPETAQAQRIEQEKPDANMCLKYTFGVNAWKQWVMTKNAELEKAASNNRKLKLFKPEILQLTADELNYSLCLFVKEVRKPNGSEYAPDTIYYLCLGIQQYLFENARIDNIFTDSYYEKFTECLDEVAKKFAVLYNDSQYIVTRVEEEHLWESKQLGAHSPHVLLSTLMFFNTKHFNLTTVEEHMQLSFSHIMKHWKRNPNQPGVTKVPGSSRNVLLRFYPPQSALDANSRKKKVYEQQENEENPLRCPVKLYEFYLSKCPESVKTRNDVFYLLPERSCVPDSPVWYSTMALGKEPLVKMLNRVKMVKEINVALIAS